VKQLAIIGLWAAALLVATRKAPASTNIYYRLRVPQAGKYDLYAQPKQANGAISQICVNGEALAKDLSFESKAKVFPGVALPEGGTIVKLALPRVEKGRNDVHFVVTEHRVSPRQARLEVEEMDPPPGIELAGVETVIFSEGFESTPNGLLPKTFDFQKNDVTTNELCRWTTNLDAFRGRKCLMYDCTQLEDGSRGTPAPWHGWLSWWGDDKIKEGWIVWRVAFKRMSGVLQGEIRSEFKYSPTSEKTSRWISEWLKFSDTFGIRIEGFRHHEPIGAIPLHHWCEGEIWLPTPGTPAGHIWARLHVRRPDGSMQKGDWKQLPLGTMEMASGYGLMQIGGRGKAKWLFDEFSLTQEK
jgi:hypothetical protein